MTTLLDHINRATDPARHVLGCLDCGTQDMPIDTVLTGKQWDLICPEGGMLCACCIVRRASKLPDVINLTTRITYASDFAGDAPGGVYFAFLKEQDALSKEL